MSAAAQRETLSLQDEATAIGLELTAAPPQETLAWAFEEFGSRITIATGFGAEGVSLIDMSMRINPRLDVFFIDTGFLFPETYLLREQLQDRYKIEIRAISTSLSPAAQAATLGAALWESDPDSCCAVRKVEPLRDELAKFDAWITGIRRDQTAARAGAQPVEWDYRWGLVKVNPLARWTKREVWGYMHKNNVPYNRLADQGYKSIGCTHCTRAVGEGEDDRAGRWAGRLKTECGLHAGPILAAN